LTGGVSNEHIDVRNPAASPEAISSIMTKDIYLQFAIFK
jgi:hypothetical protein